ncbi:substrate-binding domain-containing protein [Belliella pelovolcani]|uniref:ABC-type nitrate/sulfonate/bicarbonate transport system, substrate-binding protein n=1 Tax=Belliella pelovolcani TaxID=529505 RepID=A0A1N7NNG3_9BACT|nr:substrate-binding domain-containing protein [Belliella pelovolcani]SIS99852.1 ABC-type nitrate/sulfonate/bicarbonate transport system, substrate-binding protein [Belliella pelovolcani]
MQKIRITGVPEHFNFPWIKVIEQQPFLKDGIELEWIEESRGSGAMNKALRVGSTDIALVLTESFIKDRIEGNPSRVIGFHIASPLIWGIHISARSPQSSLTELEDAPFLISRYGSGSHLMAFLLAQREGWASDKLKFEVIDNLDGAKKAFENPEPKMFLWEKYTTKPLVDAGQFKRVGEIPTPWPCFVIVATENVLAKHSSIIEKLRDLVYAYVKEMVKHTDFVKIIAQNYGLEEVDVKEWLQQTQWANNNEIPESVLMDTVHTLQRLDLIKNTVSLENIKFGL